MGNNIKDITKINDIDGKTSYLVTVSSDNENKTFLLSISDDLEITIKRITNLIAFAEKRIIKLDKSINEDDLKRIYKYLEIINQNDKEKIDDYKKNDNIDNQYYDKYIKIYSKKEK